MHTSIAERLASRLGQKLAKKTPFRSDFVIADYRVLDEDGKTAKVLIQYDSEAYGVPTKEDVIGTFDPAFNPDIEGIPEDFQGTVTITATYSEAEE